MVLVKFKYSDFDFVAGRTELELPDTRKRMGNQASYVDVYPFIWNEFKKHGYVTGK